MIIDLDQLNYGTSPALEQASAHLCMISLFTKQYGIRLMKAFSDLAVEIKH
jgi:hypothetical protein